jgi:hypothetical protein
MSFISVLAEHGLLILFLLPFLFPPTEIYPIFVACLISYIYICIYLSGHSAVQTEGVGTRSAVGLASLPDNIPVEIESFV